MEPTSESRPPGREPHHQPLRLLARDVKVALEHLEAVLLELDRSAGHLHAEPLEYAALLQRAETIAEELRWLRGQVTKLARRADVEEGHDERGDDTRPVLRACVQPWPPGRQPVCRIVTDGRSWGGCV